MTQFPIGCHWLSVCCQRTIWSVSSLGFSFLLLWHATKCEISWLWSIRNTGRKTLVRSFIKKLYCTKKGKGCGENAKLKFHAEKFSSYFLYSSFTWTLMYEPLHNLLSYITYGSIYYAPLSSMNKNSEYKFIIHSV